MVVKDCQYPIFDGMIRLSKSNINRENGMYYSVNESMELAFEELPDTKSRMPLRLVYADARNSIFLGSS